jgi:hypothetical protein
MDNFLYKSGSITVYKWSSFGILRYAAERDALVAFGEVPGGFENRIAHEIS